MVQSRHSGARRNPETEETLKVVERAPRRPRPAAVSLVVVASSTTKSLFCVCRFLRCRRSCVSHTSPMFAQAKPASSPRFGYIANVGAANEGRWRICRKPNRRSSGRRSRSSIRFGRELAPPSAQTFCKRPCGLWPTSPLLLKLVCLFVQDGDTFITADELGDVRAPLRDMRCDPHGPSSHNSLSNRGASANNHPALWQPVVAVRCAGLPITGRRTQRGGGGEYDQTGQPLPSPPAVGVAASNIAPGNAKPCWKCWWPAMVGAGVFGSFPVGHRPPTTSSMIARVHECRAVVVHRKDQRSAALPL